METKVASNPFMALRSLLAKSVRERKPVESVKIVQRAPLVIRTAVKVPLYRYEVK